MLSLRPALVLVATLGLACGNGSGSIVDPEPQPPAPPPGPVELGVELEGDCGKIPLGGDGLAQLRLVGTSERDVQVGVSVSDRTRLSLPGADAAGRVELVLVAGSSQAVPVVCHGKQLGRWSGQVVVSYWASEDRLQTHRVALSSDVRGARLQLDHSTLDLGDVHFFPGLPTQITSRRSLQITNAGNEVLELREPKLDSGSSAVAVALNGSKTLQPDPVENSVVLEVSIAPESPGPIEALFSIASNDLLTPTRWLRVVANAVTLAPCELDGMVAAIDFGTLTFGTPEQRKLTLRNVGSEACLLSGIRVTGSNAFVSLAPESFELAPEAEVELPILAIPHDAPAGGAVAGELELLISNALWPVVKIPLTATLPPSCLAVEPISHLTLNSIDSCGARSSFTVRNVCESPLRALAVHLPSEPFAMVQTPAILPSGEELAPSAKYRFGARVLPTEPGSYLDFVGLELSDSTFSIPLSARVEEAVEWTDTHVAPETELADVLLVVDNGDSFEDDLESLRRNLRTFGKYMHSVGGRMRVAVTTTAGTPGHARAELISSNGETVLDPKEDDFEARLGALVDGIEPGASAHDVFSVVKEVLESGEFPLRARAPLAVFVITDAREQSPMKPHEFLNFLFGQKLKAHAVTFNAIHGTGYRDCGAELDDGRYGSLVLWTNGVREDLCEPDWAKTLEPLGQLAFGYRSSYPLSRVPGNATDLEVRVDGSRIPKVDSRGATVWVYDSVANAVVLEPMFTPPPGSRLEVSYSLACGG